MATLPIRLLVIDDDSDLRLFLRDLLTEEGYVVDLGATLDEALALLETRVYHLILTDLLTHSPNDPLRSALTLRDFAHPTPVATLTGWNVTAEEVAQAGLACLISKPFDLDVLLDAVAANVEMPYTTEQRRQAEIVAQLCAAFNAHDFDTLVAHYTDDARMYPSCEALDAPIMPLIGRAGIRAGLRRMMEHAPDIRMDDYLIYPQANCLALRFVQSWREPKAPGGRAFAAASSLIQFDGAFVSQISLRVGSQRWNALIPELAYILGARPN
jgi:CheY-like chemotaxis protein